MSEQSNFKVGVISHLKTSQYVSWLPKGSLWTCPGKEIPIDYEPVSCADRYQLSCARAALNSGDVELVMHVRDVDGTMHDIRYNPFKSFAEAARPAEAARQPAAAAAAEEDPEELNKRSLDDDDQKHNIKVAAGDAASYLGIASEPVRPPVSSGGVGEATGFTKAMPAAAGVSTDEILRPQSRKTGEAPEKDPYADARKKFEALVEAKDWSGAHQVLVDAFGDRVTFTYRAVMSTKDWDALVEKYGLI